MVRQAINQPSTLPRVKRLNFCIWTQGHSVWIPVDKWDACRVPVLASTHGGRACAVGFDMSEKSDLTACAIALRIDDGADAAGDQVEIVDSDNGQEIRRTLNINFCIELQTFFWLPRDTLVQRERDEHLPLSLWERLEHVDGPGCGLRVTPGPVIDYDLIYDQFRTDLAPPFKPDRVGYDKHNASQFALQLRDKAKFVVVEVAQGRALSESFKLFDALVRLRRIRHNGNPVMGWCVSNADPKRDRYENLWLEKPSQTKRIDGVIAGVIALNQLVQLPAKRSTRPRGIASVWTPEGFREIDPGPLPAAPA
jgi:phage terminase large subunit-like protein